MDALIAVLRDGGPYINSVVLVVIYLFFAKDIKALRETLGDVKNIACAADDKADKNAKDISNLQGRMNGHAVIQQA